MLTCFDDHILLSSHALMIVCSYVYMLWWEHSTCLYALMLICLDTFMIRCSYVKLLCCSHATMIECFHVYILWWSHGYLPICLWAHMLGCFDNYLLLFWNDLMTACSHALIFTCLISTHISTHLDDEMSIGSKAKVIV